MRQSDDGFMAYFMFDIFTGLDTHIAILLGLALLFVLAYEFINGFHDTANAVATVIYTKAMPAQLAVVLSGFFNFFGVLLGGLSVAYAIVHLLPIDLLVNISSTHGLIMVFSMLLTAIVWNFGTWYLGLPASSSHTLIGSILGVGVANALMTHTSISDGVNLKKALDVMLSLIVSPLVGLAVAGVVLLTLKRLYPTSHMHLNPEERQLLDGKKHPPFWPRTMLILSSFGVSFAHGSNDGQKGIGLLMLVLIGIAPSQFVVNMDASKYEIAKTADAAEHIAGIYASNTGVLDAFIARHPVSTEDNAIPQGKFHCNPAQTRESLDKLGNLLRGVNSYSDLDTEQRRMTRRLILCIDDTAKKVASQPGLSKSDSSNLNTLRADLNQTTEYAPTWVIVAVALALGLGTLVGWRRIVVTVGEKIGERGMGYSQGMAAQITAASAIGIASITGMPVSTTHVLSSAVAGSMLANKNRLQSGTVKSILMAWVFTLPATMLLSCALFWIASYVIL